MRRNALLFSVLAALLAVLCACASPAPAPEDGLPVTVPDAEETGAPCCTVSISCAAILNAPDALDPDKHELIPEDGWLLAPTTVALEDGDTVFDILRRVTREYAIHMEFSETPGYGSAYIEGIGNLYEFDCGPLSGWMYAVNGEYPNYGCAGFSVSDGDEIAWRYTCDLGADIGGEGAQQS